MLKKLFIAASLCSLIGAPLLTHAQDQTGAVSAVVEKLRVQMVTPDRAALSALIADELNYGHSNARVDTKTSFIDDLMSGMSDFLSIELIDQTVRVVGDVAIVRHTLTGGTHDKGKDPGIVNLKVLLIFQKQAGQWKLLARQAVRV